MDRLRISPSGNKKATLAYIISGILFALVVVAGMYYFLFPSNIKSDSEAYLVSQASQIPPIQTYTNESFRYRINYESSWRIASDYSKYVSILRQTNYQYNAAGCGLHTSASAITGSEQDLPQIPECTAAQEKLLQIKLDNFRSNWRVENSDYLAITDDTADQEQQWIKDQADGISAVDSAKGHVIEIYPSQQALGMESNPSSTLTDLTLKNGDKATQLREVSVNPSLQISVPDAAYWAKNIIFKTTAVQGSDLESEFIHLVDSTKMADLGLPAPIAEKRIFVSLKDQILVYAEGSRVINDFYISGGRAGHPTPVGDFTILKKKPVVNYTGANYSYPNTKWNLMFKTGNPLNYYIHGAYWHNNFGHPMSGGCVNVSYANMEALYNWADIGTKVTITNDTLDLQTLLPPAGI